MGNWANPLDTSGGGGGPPGTWRKVASGTVTLANNVTTNLSTFTLDYSNGERIGGVVLTPRQWDSGWFAFQGEPYAPPTNARAQYALVSNNGIPGSYQLLARQFNAAALSVAYDWVLYAVKP